MSPFTDLGDTALCRYQKAWKIPDFENEQTIELLKKLRSCGGRISTTCALGRFVFIHAEAVAVLFPSLPPKSREAELKVR